MAIVRSRWFRRARARARVVEHDDGAVVDQARGEARDPLLLLGLHPQAHIERAILQLALGAYCAPVRADDDALAIELVEISPDRVDGHVEVLGETSDGDLSDLLDIGGEIGLPARGESALRRRCGCFHADISSTSAQISRQTSADNGIQHSDLISVVFARKTRIQS